MAVRPRRPIVALAIAGSLVAGTFVPAIGASASQGTGSGSGSGAGSASVSIRLLEGPSNRADDPRASQYVVDHLQPGDRIERRFAVTNGTDHLMELQLYDAAAEVRDGAFHFAADRGGNELTGWTSVEPAALRVGPGASGTGTVTIAVPASASGGERYGVVWAELPGAASPSGVTVVNRVGIRIYLSVGGEEEPPTRFRVDTFTPVRDADGRPGVDIAACNDGGRAVDLEASLELTEGPGGTSAGPFSSDGAATLAPGDCGPVAVRAPADLPAGPWTARAKLRSGRAEQSATARVTFPAPGQAAAGPPVAAERVTDTPGGRLLVLLALLLLLLALLLLLWWLLRRRRRRDDGADGDATGEQGAAPGG